jgi:hypothetical protein
MAMNREQVLAASKRRNIKEVKIEREGWDVVRLRELSVAEMFAFRKETKDQDDEAVGIALLARCWVGDDDAPLFAGEEGQADLGAIPVDVLSQLGTAVLEVNGLGEKAQESAGNG